MHVLYFRSTPGDLRVVDLQMTFLSIDDQCNNRLSHARYQKDQKQWCKDEIQLHRDFVDRVVVLIKLGMCEIRKQTCCSVS